MAKIQIRAKKVNYAVAPKKLLALKKRTVASGRGPIVQDARQKLIQQKRKTVVDARDILAKMAKNQDARSKLNKIRQHKTPGGAVVHRLSKENVRAIGANILRKTDRHGKITLVTNKPLTKGSSINAAIQKELSLMNSFHHPLRKPLLKLPPRGMASLQQQQHQQVQMRQAILNDMDQTAYRWAKPNIRSNNNVAASHLIGSLEPRKQQQQQQQMMINNTNKNRGGGINEWASYPITRTFRMPTTSNYVDLDATMDDEEMPMAPIKQTITLQGSSRISNIHSRLDSIPVVSVGNNINNHRNNAESHGIFAQTKTKVVVPAGHRIVVSNLQSTVTQDDVKELFEDIGQLLAARLVRPGVAEVIYKNLKDAQKAVDTYHNRQLDGQPMKCLLVNKRPLNNPTAPALANAQGVLIPEGMPIASNSVAKLVPDISTIHKVLFQRK